MTTSDKMTLNTSQRKALAALGLPLWHQRQQYSQTSARVSEFFYRADEWLLVSTTQLPVSRPQWLIDMFTWLEIDQSIALIEVSASTIGQWPQNRVLNVSTEADGSLLALSKRELWQKLSRLSL